MSRELPGYRDQLESIMQAFPNKECLHVKEIAAYTGIDRRKVPQKFPLTGSGRGAWLSRVNLARALCPNQPN